MKPASRQISRVWAILPVCALGFLLWVDGIRLKRVEAVTALSAWSVDAPAVDAGSATGYAGGLRGLIVPQHNSTSQEWIMQTQQMLEHGEWRLRQVMYDNAPSGRETHLASPYRWWLGLVAWLDHGFSGRPFALSVERAALYADPLEHFLFLMGVTIFIGWRFGLFPAALVSVGLVTMFPLAGGFLPGAPDQHGLAWICAFGSMLALLAGLRAGATAPSAKGAVRRWFFIAGLAGGVGLWISAASFVPLVAGIGLGALAAAWFSRAKAGKNLAEPVLNETSWRAWGAGGAGMSVAAYLFEYFPGHLGWHLEVNHPLYALAWLGGAELLARAVEGMHGKKPEWKLRDILAVVFALGAVVALPVAMYKLSNHGVFTTDPLAMRLTGLGDIAAPDVSAWIVKNGYNRLVGATALPLLLLVPAGWLLFWRGTAGTARAAIALALGPVLVALGFAWFQLSWWSLFDGLLLVLLVAGATATEATGLGRYRILWSGGLVLVAAFGVAALLPERNGKVEESLTDVDVEGLVERDLAHWLAQRAGPEGAIIFAPPNVTSALAFHGGLRGLLGVFAWENPEGLSASIRIAGATTSDEALALIQRRGVNYLVVPSWDPMLDEFARLGTAHAETSFVNALHHWALPFWLRPVPYTMPKIPGFEKQTLLVLEVVDEQEPTTALSRVAEYFVEMGRADLAAATQVKLRQYPGNLGVLTALARVEASLGEQGEFAETFAAVLSGLAAQGDDALAWDRRVSLAMVLARGDRFDLSRVQVLRCLASVDEARLRSLPTTSLFHLQMLGKKFNLGITDQKLRQLARDLLPPGTMRDRLAQ